MQLMRYTHPEDFFNAARDFLAAREAEHNLMIGLTSTLMIDPLRYGEQPYFAVVTVDNAIVAAALRTPPHNLILSWMADPAPMDLILEDVHQTFGTLVPGVIALSTVAKAAAIRWQNLTGYDYRLLLAERIYQLEQVIPAANIPGQMRLIQPADRALVAQWLVDFGMEALPEEVPSLADAERNVDLALAGQQRRFFVWEDDGALVSLGGCGGETIHGIRIGPVYTPPDKRGKGYASALVAGMSQLLLDEGRKYCFLFTDLANPTSNRIYQNIGYEPVADVDVYAFKAPAPGAPV